MPMQPERAAQVSRQPPAQAARPKCAASVDVNTRAHFQSTGFPDHQVGGLGSAQDQRVGTGEVKMVRFSQLKRLDGIGLSLDFA
jgi:hypothetical protein